MLLSDTAGDLTLDRVLEESRTSKGQLFHYFPGGKEELLLAVAQYEADHVLEDQQPYLSSLDTWDSWQAWRNALVDRYRLQGARCPLASLMNQVGAVPGAAEVSTALLKQWQAYLRRGIVNMQERGEIAEGLDADQNAMALIAGIQGGVAVLRTTGRTEHLETVLDLLLTQLRRDGRSRPETGMS